MSEDQINAVMNMSSLQLDELERGIEENQSKISALRDSLAALIYTADRYCDMLPHASDRYDLACAIGSAKDSLK